MSDALSLSRNRPVAHTPSYSRRFEITSFQAESYARSRNYLDAWQLNHLMELLVKDADNPPLEELTPGWFVQRYIERYRDIDRQKRIIYTYAPNNDDNSNDARGVVTQPRFLRHLSSADVRGRFAAQAEWLLASAIEAANTKPLFDLPAWVRFCQDVQVARRRAQQTRNERWGMPHNLELSDLEYSSSNRFGLTRFGGSPEDWDKRLRSALKRKVCPKNISNFTFL